MLTGEEASVNPRGGCLQVKDGSIVVEDELFLQIHINLVPVYTHEL